jgi:hypothetical protein
MGFEKSRVNGTAHLPIASEKETEFWVSCMPALRDAFESLTVAGNERCQGIDGFANTLVSWCFYRLRGGALDSAGAWSLLA